MTERPGLSVTGLRAGYGGMEVVHGIAVDVRAGEVAALVGRNGAGKTTALAAIAGLRRGRNAGAVLLGDRDLTGADPAEVFAAGIAFVPEGHRLFANLTVEENLRLGAYPWRRSRRSALRRDLDDVYELFPQLASAARRQAGELSGGQQQMVATGQALMAEPATILLDEPSSGLAPIVVDAIYGAVRQLRVRGMAVLVVEQDLDRALSESDHAYVLDRGNIAVGGPSGQLRSDRRVSAIVRGVGEQV
jgi:branched-chain amino acid transport system ATP-binding protein